MSFRSEFEQARDFLILHRADYDYAYEHFQWPKLDKFNWALDYFDSMAEGNHKPALWFVDENGREEKYSYSDLSLRSNQVANYLRHLGIQRGDHLLLMVGNDTSQWEILLAALKIGAVIVPTSSLLSSEELEDRMLRGSVRAIVTTKAESARFNISASGIAKVTVDGVVSGWSDYAEAVQEKTDFFPEGVTRVTDPIVLYFVSGMTAKPKMVIHTHLTYAVGNLSTMYWMGLRPGDLHMNISSAGWAEHIWSNSFAPWNAEAAVFVYKQSRFSAVRELEAITKYYVTSLSAPPTVWRLFLAEDLSSYKTSLREVVSVGEPLEPNIIQKVEGAWGLTIRDGYGQTETTMLIGNTPGQNVKGLGRPLPGIKIQLLDKSGEATNDGEICVERRQELFHTSDLASRDEKGYFIFLGRADEIFKCSDYRISPYEIEAVLLEHPAIREVAVIPSPDPLRLAVPKAVVFLAKGIEPTKDVALSIMIHTRAKLAPFKRVRRVEFSDLPKSVSGNIRRLELRLREQKKVAGDERSPYEFWEEDFKASLPEIWAQDLP